MGHFTLRKQTLSITSMLRYKLVSHGNYKVAPQSQQQEFLTCENWARVLFCSCHIHDWRKRWGLGTTQGFFNKRGTWDSHPGNQVIKTTEHRPVGLPSTNLVSIPSFPDLPKSLLSFVNKSSALQRNKKEHLTT